MADPIFNAKKAALINIVKENDCSYANFINENGNSYADLAGMLFSMAKEFDCNPLYLDQLFSPFDDADLISNGIYYNKSATTITNPKYVAKCTNVDVVVNAGGDYPILEIAHGSEVNDLTVSGNTIIEALTVGGGSEVNTLEVEDGSVINSLYVKGCNTYNSSISLIKQGSTINYIYVADDATITKIECEINPIV